MAGDARAEAPSADQGSTEESDDGPSAVRAAGVAFVLTLGVYLLVAGVRMLTGVGHHLATLLHAGSLSVDAVFRGLAPALVAEGLRLGTQVEQFVLLGAVTGLAIGLWSGRRVLAKAVGTGMGAGLGVGGVFVVWGAIGLLAPSRITWSSGRIRTADDPAFVGALVVALVLGSLTATVVAAVGVGFGRLYAR